MPFNPLRFLQKEISRCPYCHHIIIGHYKKLKHQARCKKEHRKKLQEQSHMKISKWRSWAVKLRKREKAGEKE